MRRAVITGVAVLCSLGDDHESVFQALCDKKQVLKEFDKEEGDLSCVRAKYFTPIPEYDDSMFSRQLMLVKKRGGKRSANAVFTALKALKDSGISTPDENTAIIVGEGCPAFDEIDRLLYKKFAATGKMDPMTAPTVMPNATASWVSIVLGTHGRSITMSTACASGTDSIGMGYDMILSGRCDMALCGGNEYLYSSGASPVRAFESLRAITHAEDGRSIPFSKEREGFLFSEGGCGFLVIEELEHALTRGANIYAEITGYEFSSDAHNIVSLAEDGVQIENMLRRLIGSRKVDYYNAHGTGTVLNDKVESQVIQRIFGDDPDGQPAINSTKAFIGHTLGASGAIEAAVCADSIRHGKIHGNITGTILENLNVTSETRELDVKCAVSASFGFGGHNSCIMLEKFAK